MTWSQLVIHSQSSCKPPSLLAPAPLPACPPDSSNCLPVCLICLHAKSQSAHLCTSSALLPPPSRSALLSPPVSVPSRTVPPFVELHRKETIRKEGEREERREQRKKNKNNRRRTCWACLSSHPVSRCHCRLCWSRPVLLCLLLHST